MSLRRTIAIGTLIALLAGCLAVLGAHNLPRDGGWYTYAFVDIFAGVGSLLILLLIIRLERQQEGFHRQQEQFNQELKRFDDTMLKAIKALQDA